MKKTHFLLLLAGLHTLCAFGQKEGNIWHFGQGQALDFNSGTPVVTTPSSMWTFEGCASIADADGNLLFYTNGGGRDPFLSGQSSGKIWNRNHAVMYDMGNTEGGGFSSAQSSIILPKPGSPGRYFVFTMEEVEFDVGGPVVSQPDGRGLSYFEVDMSLNGGLGGVAAYFGEQYVPSYEGLCAVRHSNGSDYWIIVHRSDNLGLAVFPVTSNGLGLPQLFVTPGSTASVIKGSPDGRWLSCYSATPNGNPEQAVFEFDPATGTVGAAQILIGTNVSFAEFSPNSQRLFFTDSDNLVQYVTLGGPNIAATKTLVGALQSGLILINGQMQLASDGQIYFLQVSFVSDDLYISAIGCPNSTPFLELEKITLTEAPGGFTVGLPNFDNAIFRRDGAPLLPVSLGTDQVLCTGQSVVLNPGGPAGATYQWSSGEQTQTLNVSAPGQYAVTVTAPGCGVGIDTVVVTQADLQLDAGPDAILCAGDVLTLEGSGDGTLSWSPANLVSNPNVANPTFTGTADATLVLTATEGTCTTSDTVLVTVIAAPQATASPLDTTIVAGESVNLTGTGNGDLLWSPGAGLSCTACPNPVASPTETTTYVLTVTNDAGCSDTVQVTVRVTPPDCDLQIPNAFTPDGDQVNDSFKPLGAIESFDLTVFNRWGQKVFEGRQAWDGQMDGQPAPCDVYLFQCNVRLCGATQTRSGDVTLLR